METGLQGRTALVTGGSRGIGKAIATAMALEGCNVVLVSRKQDALDAVAKEIGASCPDVGVLAVAGNVSSSEDAQRCVAAAKDRFGRVDVLVNNAATNPYFGTMADLDLPRAEKIISVNQIGVLLWTQQAWRASMQEHGGSIINISSIGGMVTEPFIGWYNATKAAIIHLTRQFALEMSPGVRVNAIAPGLVRTDFARALWEPHEDRIAAKLPLGRIGEPTDIAAAAVFLASDAASWLTGQTIVVDGGAQVLPQIT